MTIIVISAGCETASGIRLEEAVAAKPIAQFGRELCLRVF